MDSKLVLTLMFVTLTGCFMGTYAQNTTVAPSSTISVTPVPTTSTNATSDAANTNTTTTAPPSNTPNTTTNASTTAPPSNTPNTTTNASTTAPPSNTPNTTTNASTTAPPSNTPNTTTNASTTAPPSNTPNTTTNASTTAPPSNTPNTTTNASTTAPSSNTPNTTTNASTTAPSSTTAAPTTPAPLVPDSNVTTLNDSITKDNCSKTQLCVSQPSGCDPSSGGCFFLGAQQLGGQNFRFSLAGQSDGYIALTLSRNTTLGTNDTTYICAKNNNEVKYISALVNNGKLTQTTLNVNNVKGKVNGKNIQCQFSATVPNATSTTTRADTGSTSYSMSVSNGTYNATSNDLGSPAFQIRTNVGDLSNVAAAINNLITSAANAVTIQQSMMQALLITVGILTLSWL